MPFLYLHLYLTIIIDKTPASAQLYNCVVNHVNVFITVRSIIIVPTLVSHVV